MTNNTSHRVMRTPRNENVVNVLKNVSYKKRVTNDKEYVA